ncbi:hypothetical protein PRZ48_003072 [Zasmidium cellare]|uniref:Xylanolytic transcriptional activator regulatory domain-containing protein n=1 Tax=Zasmidium cellare TaxID=395010 RepID=A0ABR0EUM3_ZASCE|nr:hypothetical protein PRZ48_003072 [Zasmidium cellare]
MTNATTRPRQGRRESASAASNGNGRVRKNSVANANIGGAAGNLAQQRPRANTISHIDLASLGLVDGNHPHLNRMNALGLGMAHPMNVNGLPGPNNFDYRGMSTAVGHHGNNHGLPKLDTQHINNMDMSNSLRTAPAGNFGGFDIDQLFTPHTTINPAALHFGGAGQIASSNIPFGYDMSSNQQVPVDDDFGWMRNWNMQMANGNDNEQAIDESSPSRISSGDSPADFSESMSNSQVGISMPQSSSPWPQQEMQAQQMMPTGPFHMDAMGNGLPNLDAINGTVSPTSLHDPTPTADAYFHQAMAQQNGHPQHHQSMPDIMQGQNGNAFGNPLSNFGSNSPSMSSSSMTGSARQSSVTSMSTDSITDSTRQALLNSLNQPSVYGTSHRKFSQPSVSSPLSPGAARGAVQSQGPTLPATADIRRYIDAFIQFAAPHLPVCHVATLSFDVIESNSGPRGTPPSSSSAQSGNTGGARCLILGMAAIGALYEYDHPASKDLFEAAKKMIQLYLEERRKADISAAANGANAGSETPLWLVQAMLLTVIYGHHCGDRIAADIASNHIAALVSLARSAKLAKPPASPSNSGDGAQHKNGDIDMAENGHGGDLQAQWVAWKTSEERKRCLFAIFILSSLLTTAYNQTPTIMNSEILLDLPCAEELFDARSAEEWEARGGLAAAEASSISFASSLSTLLTANQRQGNNFAPSIYNSSSDAGMAQPSGEEELRPSTFGCLVLINALHNYIWETRSRHPHRPWTSYETEQMVQHIEPALNAWQVAWKSHPHHKLERPNPFGLGPLSADSIPLLDLAFVRLYVNLGRTAEAFWQRDFDGMANALADYEEDSEGANGAKVRKGSAGANGSANNSPAQRRPSQLQGGEQNYSRREKHLRKAAFYAADSLTIACNYSLTYADATAHELPIQSAICFFDCCQVLAEWVTTIQERVGNYLGVIGRDHIDYGQVPAIMLLTTEDVELLRKIGHICDNMEEKRLHQESLLAMDMNNFNPATGMNHLANGVDLSSCGLGSKVLRVTAMMLEKAVIWPITHVMAKALETEASHMDRRAAASCTQ